MFASPSSFDGGRSSFSPRTRAPLSVRHRVTSPVDRHALVELFRATFPKNDARASPKTPEHWLWKYFDHPGANHSLLTETEDRRILAHVGGIALPTRCFEKTRLSVHATDHMVSEEQRGRGLFVETMRAWLERHLAADKDFLGWGFPSPRAFLLGRDYLGYSMIRTMDVLVQPHGFRPRARESGRSEPLEGVPRDVLELWNAMPRPIGVVRDHAYLSWRYERHPNARYTLHVVRDAGNEALLRGFAVTTACPFANDVTVLLEWMVREDDDEARDRLLAVAWSNVARTDRPFLGVAAGEATRDEHYFRALGFTPWSTQIRIAARCWDETLSDADLREHLYVTIGDMDSL